MANQYNDSINEGKTMGVKSPKGLFRSPHRRRALCIIHTVAIYQRYEW